MVIKMRVWFDKNKKNHLNIKMTENETFLLCEVADFNQVRAINRIKKEIKKLLLKESNSI